MRFQRLILVCSLILWIPLHGIMAQTIPGRSKDPNDYTMVQGNLRIIPYHQLFFNMTMNEVRTDTIFLYNNWGSTMQLVFRSLPPFMTITAVPDLLPPHSFGYLLVTYDATKRNGYDIVTDGVEMLTNDTLQPAKQLGFIAVIGEDFSNFTLRDFRNAPVASLNTNLYDFGTIKQGKIVRYDLQLSNTGIDTLHIRKINSTCGCTTGQPVKYALTAGESTTIQVIFNTFGRSGQQSKTVTVITNDPDNSHLNFTIGGVIE
jgi:hypothetical protein